jgi:hypothetical protein
MIKQNIEMKMLYNIALQHSLSDQKKLIRFEREIVYRTP